MRAITRNLTFVRNFLTMLGGTVVARVIAIAVAPIIARLFDPETFGVAAIFVALVVLLTTVATLRYDQAIIIAQNENDAAGLSRLTLLVLTGFSAFFVIIALALFFFDVPLGRYASLGPWLLLVPVGVFLTGATEVFRGRIIRQKGFSRVAQGEVIFASGSAGARISGGLALGSSLIALIAGHLLGVFLQLFYLIFVLRSGPATEPVSRGDMRRLGRDNKQFPLFATPTAFLRTLSEYLPILAFGILYAPAVVGFYAFARRLVAMPATTVNRAIRQVYLQKIAEIHYAGRRSRGALIKTTFVLLLAGIPPTVALMFFGEPLFGLVLGDRWTTAGQYAEIISPWLLSTVASAPASATYMIYKQQHRLLHIHVVLTALRILIFVAAYTQQWPVDLVLVLLTASGVLGNVWIIAMGWMIAGKIPISVAANED